MKLIQQLQEVLYIDDMSATYKKWADAYKLLGTKFDIDKSASNFKYIGRGSLQGGFWVLIDLENSNGGEVWDNVTRRLTGWNVKFLMLAVDKKNIVQVAATLYKFSVKSKFKSFMIRHLVSKNGSTIPAHIMYAAAIKSGITILSDSQSEGGKRVWEKLSKISGINVYGWNKKTKTPINLGNQFDDDSETHAHEDDPGRWENAKWDIWDIDRVEGPGYKKQKAELKKQFKTGAEEEKHVRDILDNVILVATKS